jgi:hypothetical protein
MIDQRVTFAKPAHCISHANDGSGQRQAIVNPAAATEAGRGNSPVAV